MKRREFLKAAAAAAPAIILPAQVAAGARSAPVTEPPQRKRPALIRGPADNDLKGWQPISLPAFRKALGKDKGEQEWRAGEGGPYGFAIRHGVVIQPMTIEILAAHPAGDSTLTASQGMRLSFTFAGCGHILSTGGYRGNDIVWQRGADEFLYRITASGGGVFYTCMQRVPQCENLLIPSWLARIG